MDAATGRRVRAGRYFFYAALGEELTAYAERHFALSSREGEKTRAEALQVQLERAHRKGNAERVAELEAELAMPDFPRIAAYLWRIYFRLRRRMAGGFAGPNPIGWQDIEAFVRVTGVRLAGWELDLLETIDDLYLVGSTKKPTPSIARTQGIVASASMSDGPAVHALMSTLGVRKTVVRKRGQNG